MVDRGQLLMCRESDDLIAACIEKRIAGYHHPRDALTSQGRERDVDLGIGARIHESDGPTDRSRRFRELLLLLSDGWVFWIEQGADRGAARKKLVQKAEPLRLQIGGE